MRQVCIVNLVQLEPTINGGTSRIAYEVCKILAEWSLLNPNRKVVFEVGWRFAARFRGWLGEDVFVAPHIFPGDAQKIFRMSRPDTIISPQFGLSPFAGKLFWDAQHIVGMPDTLVLDKPGLFSPYQFRRRAALYKQLTQAAIVVTLSEYSKQQLQYHLNIPLERLRVIQLGADVLVQTTPDENLHLPKRYVFYPANIWLHKRHELLLQIMKILWEQQPNLYLVLSGGRDSHSTMKLHDLIQRYQCPHERIVDMGYVTDAQLRSLYQGAEALLFVSEYEGFGMPLLEAMQHGCPVICAPVTSIPEVVGESGLYVNSDRPEDWAKAFLQELPQQRETLVQNGFRRAQLFTWRKTREKWKATFEECGLNMSQSPKPMSVPTIEKDQHSFLAQLEKITQGAASGMSRGQEIPYLIRHFSQFQAVRHEAQSALSAYLQA